MNRRTLTKASGCRNADGLSLVEMLFVMGLVAVMAALAFPAIQGLVGASGQRGGVNIVVNTIERARMAAIENGGNTYVAFAPANAHADVSTRALMAYRDPREGETARVGLTRWILLPAGVVYTLPPGGLETNADWTGLPLLVSPNGAVSSGDMPVIRFDRFGRVPPFSSFEIRIGVSVGPAQKTKETITVHRLTGRVAVTDNPVAFTP
jgi:type II secretory pathway pseudopilin PulG